MSNTTNKKSDILHRIIPPAVRWYSCTTMGSGINPLPIMFVLLSYIFCFVHKPFAVGKQHNYCNATHDQHCRPHHHVKAVTGGRYICRRCGLLRGRCILQIDVNQSIGREAIRHKAEGLCRCIKGRGNDFRLAIMDMDDAVGSGNILIGVNEAVRQHEGDFRFLRKFCQFEFLNATDFHEHGNIQVHGNISITQLGFNL